MAGMAVINGLPTRHCNSFRISDDLELELLEWDDELLEKARLDDELRELLEDVSPRLDELDVDELDELICFRLMTTNY